MKISNTILITAIMFLTIPALAETPKGTLYKVFSALKSSEDVSPLVEIVDWDENFQDLDLEQRTYMRVNSPEDLKRSYFEMAVSNGQYVIDQIILENSKSNSNNNNINHNLIKDLKSKLKEIQTKNSYVLSNTKFVIKKVNLKDGKASVILKKTYEGQETEVNIELKQVGEQWLTKNAAPLNPVGPGQSPIGAFVNPLAGTNKQ